MPRRLVPLVCIVGFSGGPHLSDQQVLAAGVRGDADDRDPALTRQVRRPDLNDADHALLAALSRLLPRPSWEMFFVTPSTLLRRHRETSRKRCFGWFERTRLGAISGSAASSPASASGCRPARCGTSSKVPGWIPHPGAVRRARQVPHPRPRGANAPTGSSSTANATCVAYSPSANGTTTSIALIGHDAGDHHNRPGRRCPPTSTRPGSGARKSSAA